MDPMIPFSPPKMPPDCGFAACFASTVGVPAAGSLEFSADDYPVSEDAGSVVITVTRVGGSTSKVSANFTTADGTATDGTDYSFTDGLLTWADGDTADKTFSVPITNDPDVESAETVNLSLSKHLGLSSNPCDPGDPSNPNNPCDGATVGPRSTATITIAASDPDTLMHGSLQFTTADFKVNENAGNAVITVSRTVGSDGAVSVNFTSSNGTATDGADYTFTDGFLTWADGDMADKTFTVPIIDDTDVEEPETVNLTLSNPTGLATLGAPNTATLTITDDDMLTCDGQRVTIPGTPGNDTNLIGTAGPDVIHGLGGNDVIRGFRRNDIICGGKGSDRLFGGRGMDRLFGGKGIDRVFGGRGVDRLFGQRGGDFLLGQRGNDALDGGPKFDLCNGGPGENTAVRCERRINIP